MAGNKQYEYSKYFLFALVIILAVIVFMIIHPFINAILAGIIISYIFYPLHKRINKLVRQKTISAFITSALALLIIAAPIAFFLNSISKEAYVSYIVVKQKILYGNLLDIDCETEDNPLCPIPLFFKEIVSDPKNRYYIEDTLHKVTSSIIENASSLLFSLPLFFLNFFIIVFIMFYLFKDGAHFFEKIKRILPFKKPYQEMIFRQFNDILYAVIYGQLLIALIQGILGGIGFFIFGVSSPILWGIAMAFFALIPFIGTPIIWLPVTLLQIFTGISQHDSTMVSKGIFLMLYCLLIVGTIDNILRPKVIGDRAKIHPVLILLGVVGGLRIFGIVGLVIGPVILAIFMTIVRIYEERKLHISLK